MSREKYLKIERLSSENSIKYLAYLTTDGKTIDDGNKMEVELHFEKEVITSKVSGEFLTDYDLKLEALFLMKWFEEVMA